MSRPVPPIAVPADILDHVAHSRRKWDRQHFDVVIIGSGPAGVAVAERLYERRDPATIAVIERGPILLRGHFYDSRESIHARDRFFERYRDCPWAGQLSQGGALLPCLGGRGIVGGSQLHRFYPRDFTLWPDGRWAIDATQLDPYFREAEERLLGGTRSVGPSQEHACAALAEFGARHPPYRTYTTAASGPDFGFPHRSSAQRILALLERDRSAATRRLAVLTETAAIELVPGGSQRNEVSHVRCVRPDAPSGSCIAIYGTVFVLAASPVESARLVLVSGLGDARSSSSSVGRYLAEHTYGRGYLDISDGSELNEGPINVFIPPRGADPADRYQIEIRSMRNPDDSRGVLRVTGSAAMDPRRENRVMLSPDRVDQFGVPRALTVLTRSTHDERRTRAMLDALHAVASRLGGRWLTPPALLPYGASYHEAGTLRIADTEQDSAARPDGLLFGMENVFVGDGAAFASVGVANPILTLTAMGYRLADGLVL